MSIQHSSDVTAAHFKDHAYALRGSDHIVCRKKHRKLKKNV
jgi:hypothetical protein